MSQSVVKIKDVCEFVRGLTYSKSDEVEYSNNAVLRATNIDLNSNRLNLTEIRYIADSVNVRADKKVRVNDILICTASGSKSHLGKVALIEEKIDMAFGGFMGVLRAKPNINPKYLFAFLRSEIFVEHVFNTGDGANINNLKFSQFEDLEIVLPSLPIQQKIVAKLDAIFTEIDKAMALAEANAKNAKVLFQSYLSQVFERGGEGWILTLLDKVCKVDRGSSPRPIKEYFTESNDGVNWIKIGDTEEGGKYIFSTNQKITKAGAEKSRYVEVGDFILTNSMSYGRPYIMRINGYIHDGWFVLRLNKDIDSEYFYYLLTSPYVQSQFQSLAAGAVVKNISGDLVKKTVLPIPSLTEQKKLAEIFSEKQMAIKRLSEVYSEKANELSMLKQSILTKAFNSELIKE